MVSSTGYVQGHHLRKMPRFAVTDTGWITPCWVWLLAKTPAGYGLERLTRGSMALAHRIYYERHVGPISPGKQIDHLCRVRSCVNPAHMELVTPGENVRRGRRTKLRWNQVREIRASTETQAVLGQRFGVSASHISRVRTGKVWRGDAPSLDEGKRNGESEGTQGSLDAGAKHRLVNARPKLAAT